jgi:general secretion pathway protein H
MFAFGDFGASRRLRLAAEQLVNTIQLAQQQALLEVSTLGVKIDNHGYQVLAFEEGKGFVSRQKNTLFKMHYFPGNTVVTIKSATQGTPNTPAILLYASGDMSPFTLYFGTSKEAIITLEGQQNGHMYFE